jgi:hypothetical protein
MTTIQLDDDRLLPIHDQLGMAAVAELAGIICSSIRTYLRRKVIPAPSGYLGRTPWWDRQVIDSWIAVRPGRGRQAAIVPRHEHQRSR